MADQTKSDEYREKYRPQDVALDQEVDAALAGLSMEDLYAFNKPEPGVDRAAGGAGTEGAEGKAAPATRAIPQQGMRRGQIIRVDKDYVFVDFGGKSQGIANFAQFEQEPKVGDEMEFHVDRFDPAEGLLILTLKGAPATGVNWENLEIGQVVEGAVTGMNKGGLEMDIKGMRAFMPAGQVDLYFQKDISVFIGQRMTVEVTQFDRGAKNLIVSRRNILEREKEEARQKLMTELEVGQTRRGTVRSIMDFGAFVDLGGVDGLLHVSEMSWRRGTHPSEVVKVGDLLDVKILKIDKETGKLSLSLKQAMADPWAGAEAKYAVGTELTGRIARVESFGAFVEVEEGLEGLLPVSEISWQRIRHPADVVKPGDTVRLVVISFDPAQKRMSLSLKQAGPDPWKEAGDRFPAHSVVEGTVTRVVDFGAFVELEPGLEGLVHISELAANRIRSAGDAVKPGQKVKVRVLEVDAEGRRVSLSVKRAAEPAAAPQTAAPAVAAPAPEPGKKPKKRPPLKGGLDWGW